MKRQERRLLTFVCPKCRYKTYPFGMKNHFVPYIANVTCQKCGYIEENCSYPDSKINRELVERKLGIKTSPVYEQINSLKTQLETIKKETEVLKESRDADRKELQLLRQIVDTVIKDLKDLQTNHSEVSSDIGSTLERIKKLEDEIEFRKDNK